MCIALHITCPLKVRSYLCLMPQWRQPELVWIAFTLSRNYRIIWLWLHLHAEIMNMHPHRIQKRRSSWFICTCLRYFQSVLHKPVKNILTQEYVLATVYLNKTMVPFPLGGALYQLAKYAGNSSPITTRTYWQFFSRDGTLKHRHLVNRWLTFVRQMDPT